MMKRTCLIVLMIIAVLAVSLSAFGENAPWDCPDCGRTGNTGNFCGGCGHPAPAESSSVSIGDILKFGHYEQDNNLDNGPEAIEWIVLDYDEPEHKALLISLYGLDTMVYNEGLNKISWEECTLRAWLNNDFISQAFSSEERPAVLTATVFNTKSQSYSAWSPKNERNTQDQLFLLSYAEANKYFGVDAQNDINKKSRVAPTQYAISRGARISGRYLTEDEVSAAGWWLRSSQNNLYCASIVQSNGTLNSADVHDLYVVRPAFWLNLESDIS